MNKFENAKSFYIWLLFGFLTSFNHLLTYSSLFLGNDHTFALAFSHSALTSLNVQLHRSAKYFQELYCINTDRGWVNSWDSRDKFFFYKLYMPFFILYSFSSSFIIDVSCHPLAGSSINSIFSPPYVDFSASWYSPIFVFPTFL